MTQPGSDLSSAAPFVRVTIEIGRRPSMSELSKALEPLQALEQVIHTALKFAGFERERLWVEWAEFRNPFTVLLGGQITRLLERLVTIRRDWKADQRHRAAEASMAEAEAAARWNRVALERLQTALISEFLRDVGPEARQQVAHDLALLVFSLPSSSSEPTWLTTVAELPDMDASLENAPDTAADEGEDEART